MTPELKERLARALCKAQRPVVDPDAIDKLASWQVEYGPDGPMQMAWQPVREWHKRLTDVDALRVEIDVAGYVVVPKPGTREALVVGPKPPEVWTME